VRFLNIGRFVFDFEDGLVFVKGNQQFFVAPGWLVIVQASTSPQPTVTQKQFERYCASALAGSAGDSEHLLR
jgi:hypothetical protein